MNNDILIDYTERIYGYSIKHTFTREEADELSQEILFTILKQLPTLRDDRKFEPWLWGIANNVTKDFRRKQGRQRAMYSFDSIEETLYEDTYPILEDQLQEQIRVKIAQLSKIYRDIIIMHYYDNLSCKEISDKLNLPEGTVTWRLSEGRRKLKKECADMTENALKPVSMTIRINGGGNYNGKDKPFPWVFITDALSQNILYHCYREVRSIEELSKLCGVPAFYIEDTIKNLLFREALIEATRGRYQTNFIIYGEEHTKYNDKALVLSEEIVDEFMVSLRNLTKAVIDNGVYTANKSEEELCYLFGILAIEHLDKRYNLLPEVPYKVRYDGHEWTYHAHIDGTYKSGGLGTEKSLNFGSEGILSHYSYQFGGFSYRPMMLDYQINVCEKLLNHCEITVEEKEVAANLIKEGYLKINSDGLLIVQIPYLTYDQKQAFDRLVETSFTEIAPKYADIVKRYTEGYNKLFPKHLKDEAARAFYYLFRAFYVNVCTVAQQKGLIQKPIEKSICDVLLQYRKVN